MGYYDPPEDNDSVGCDYCGASEDQFIEKEDGTLYCSSCGKEEEWAIAYCKDHPCFINNYLQPEPEFIEEPLTPEDEQEIRAIQEASQYQRMINLGYFDEQGNPTDKYYRESDFAYDCAREQRYF